MKVSLSASLQGLLGLEPGDRAPFELRVGPLVQGELVVRSFELREAVSQCFEADLEVLCDLDPFALRPLLLAQPATLVLSTPGRPRRVVRGVLARAVDLGADPRFKSAHAWRLRLVPRLWLLSRKVNTRIFQHKTVPEVIGDVLRAARVPFSSRLDRTYRRAEYILQYAESDLDFVQRLCAQEGIFTYFEPPSAALDEVLGGAASALGAAASAVGSLLGDDGASAEDLAQAAGLTEAIVLCDEASRLPPIDDGTLGGRLTAALSPVAPSALSALARAPALWYRGAEGMQSDHDDAVTDFRRGREVAPSRVVMRDYDFRSPGAVHEARAEHATRGLSAGLHADVSLDGPGLRVVGRAALELDLDDALGPRWLEVYDHRQHLAEPDATRSEARTLLEQHRRDASFAEGASLCRRLSAGHRFALDEHPSGDFNREWAVAEVRHRGYVPALASGHEAAPDAPTSYVNEFRCVPSSVPLRPAPPTRRAQQVCELATVVGPAGEEVYTDPLGRVRVHFPWDREGRADAHSTCWVRVVQPWAGAAWGHQFIPRIGMEVLVTFLGGDTDLPVIVGALYNGANAPPFGLPESKTRSGIRTSSSRGGLGHNELSFEDAAGHEQVFVHAQRDLDMVAQQDCTRRVRRDLRAETGRDEVRHTGGDRIERVVGDRTVTVDGAAAFEAKGPYALDVGADAAARVEGDARVLVAGRVTADVTGACEVLAGGPDASVGVHAREDMTLAAAGHLTISAGGSITLQCGDTVLALSAEGAELRAPRLELRATEGVTLSGPGAKAELGRAVQVVASRVELFGASSSLRLGVDLQCHGVRVRLDDPELRGPRPAPVVDAPDAGPPPGLAFDVAWSDAERATTTEARLEVVAEGGEVVRALDASEASDDGATLRFTLDPEGLPAPVEVFWRARCARGLVSRRLAGPCDLATLRERLRATDGAASYGIAGRY